MGCRDPQPCSDLQLLLAPEGLGFLGFLPLPSPGFGSPPSSRRSSFPSFPGTFQLLSLPQQPGCSLRTARASSSSAGLQPRGFLVAQIKQPPNIPRVSCLIFTPQLARWLADLVQCRDGGKRAPCVCWAH